MFKSLLRRKPSFKKTTAGLLIVEKNLFTAAWSKNSGVLEQRG